MVIFKRRTSQLSTDGSAEAPVVASDWASKVLADVDAAKRAGVPPADVSQHLTFEKLLELMTVPHVDWLLKNNDDKLMLPGAFMTAERIVAAHSFFRYCKIASKAIHSEQEFALGKNDVLSLTAPKGHGKTHFVKVLAASLSAMFPDMIFAYYCAEYGQPVNLEALMKTLIAKACPELVEQPKSPLWSTLLRFNRKIVVLFVDEL